MVTPTTLVLAALVIIGFYFLALRLLYGLGAVTNINSGYPWGIWVVVDVIIGTALGCGGFAMAILIYIFNRSRVPSADTAGAAQRTVRLYARRSSPPSLDLGR